MTEILIHNHETSGPRPTFNAVEFDLPTVELKDLESGMGRYDIFNALIAHQHDSGLDPNRQAWAGINGVSLLKKRTLFSELNPQADQAKLNANFYATQLGHWRDVIGETKYSPFTYIYKGVKAEQPLYPVIVGFDLDKIVPLYPRDYENVNWSPLRDETVETALKSIYYFPRLFKG